jgi:beta-galactosidase
MLDLRVTRVSSTDPVHQTPVKGGGAVHHWRERIETGGEIVMADEDDLPVLVSQGKLFYLTASGNRALVQRVVDYLIAEADLPVLNLPAGVRCRVRGGFRIDVNYGAGAATLNKASDEAGYVVGEAGIPGAGVTVARLATAG